MKGIEVEYWAQDLALQVCHGHSHFLTLSQPTSHSAKPLSSPFHLLSMPLHV